MPPPEPKCRRRPPPDEARPAPWGSSRPRQARGASAGGLTHLRRGVETGGDQDDQAEPPAGAPAARCLHPTTTHVAATASGSRTFFHCPDVLVVHENLVEDFVDVFPVENASSSSPADAPAVDDLPSTEPPRVRSPRSEHQRPACRTSIARPARSATSPASFGARADEDDGLDCAASRTSVAWRAHRSPNLGRWKDGQAASGCRRRMN